LASSDLLHHDDGCSLIEKRWAASARPEEEHQNEIEGLHVTPAVVIPVAWQAVAAIVTRPQPKRTVRIESEWSKPSIGKLASASGGAAPSA
jgi:hypothetical protein